MATFQIRDRRKQKVESALVAAAPVLTSLEQQRDSLLADPNHDVAVLAQVEQDLATRRKWKNELQDELAFLEPSTWRTSDRTFQLTAMDWIWRTPRIDRSEIAADPVLSILNSQPALTPAFELELAGLNRAAAPSPPETLLTDVLSLTGADPSQVDEIVFTANRLRFARGGHDSPYDHSVTLLPVRIETVFWPPEEESQLLIRIVPDEVSIDRHRPMISAEELSFLREFWTSVRAIVVNPDLPLCDWLGVDGVDVPWNLLCGRVTAQRASWLASAFPPELQNGEIVLTLAEGSVGSPEELRAQHDQVRCLPWEIEVWALHRTGAGTDRIPIGVVTPRDPLTGAPLNSRDLNLPLPKSLDAATSHWLGSFEEAQRAGLGAVLDLPADVTRESIEALFVFGQSDESTDLLFQNHANAGSLGVLRIGTPSNAVQGAETADLGHDSTQWRETTRHRLRSPALKNPSQGDVRRETFARLMRFVVGRDDAVPFCPHPVGQYYDPVDDVEESRRMVKALWPVLWGHFLRDHLSLLNGWASPNADDYWRWANDNLYPEGPLPPIRIHDQPYGVLPVSALERWAPSDVTTPGAADLESRLAADLRSLCSIVNETARTPTVVDADARGILKILERDANTRQYLYRYWLPISFFETFHGDALNPDWPELLKSLRYSPVDAAQSRPPRLSTGEPQFLELPLIQATLRPDKPLAEILARLFEDSEFEGFALEYLEKIIPDSLLIRLQLESVMLTQAWLGQETVGSPQPLINPPYGITTSEIQRHRRSIHSWNAPQELMELGKSFYEAAIALAKVLDQREDWNEEVPNPYRPRRVAWKMTIPADRLAPLERAFRATLDTACHRIDPWVIGLSYRRCAAHARSDRRLFSSGVYGWVDGPIRGRPGPNEAGLLHAPSHAQAVMSVVLRDKYLTSLESHATTSGVNSWKMDIDSATVRKATSLSEEVQLGFHLYEVVGRRVERILRTRSRIETVRRARPIQPGVPDPRVVCHGIQALAALLSAAPLPEPGLEAIRTSLTAAEKDELTLLNEGLNTYGDLLVADGVLRVVQGQPHLAADAMDAAAGTSRSSNFESIRTPPSGHRVETHVLSGFQWVGAGALDDRAPCHVAEPSLARYLSARFPDAGGYRWTVRQKAPVQDLGSVPLSDLGWSLPEVALIPENALAECVLAKLGLKIDLESVELIAPREYSLCRQVWGGLSLRPLETQLFRSAEPAQAGDAVLDANIKSDLLSRLNLIRAALANLAAAAPNGIAAQKAFLRSLLAWGIVPTVDEPPAGATERPQARELFRFLFEPGFTLAEESRAAWVAAGIRSVKERQKRDPGGSDGGIAAFAKTLAELASAEGRISVLAKWPKGKLLSTARFPANPADNGLDEDWLTQIAAVRPAVARLESMQLGAPQQRLASWSSSPGDPWQTERVAQVASADSLVGDNNRQVPPLTVLYGAEDAWNSGFVAAGVIDDFGENIPLPQRNTYAAFGFNAPASRPPQAILLAVPPQPRTAMDSETLLQTLIETRELAHVRAMRPDELTSGPALLPTLWMPALGSDRVRLDPGSEYSR